MTDYLLLAFFCNIWGDSDHITAQIHGIQLLYVNFEATPFPLGFLSRYFFCLFDSFVMFSNPLFL